MQSPRPRRVHNNKARPRARVGRSLWMCWVVDKRESKGQADKAGRSKATPARRVEGARSCMSECCAAAASACLQLLLARYRARQKTSCLVAGCGGAKDGWVGCAFYV